MDVSGYLREQAGVISRSQALAAGLSASAIQRRVETRRWLVVHPQVFLSADRHFGDEARLRAAVLWGRDGAVAHGPAAAWWYGMLPRPPKRIGVTVPRDRHPNPRPGVELRRRDLHPQDLACHRGISLTGLALTVLETAVALGRDGSTFLDRALQTRVGFDWLHSAHCRNLGRQGSARTSVLLSAAADGSASQAERMMKALLRKAGITGWRGAYRWQGLEIDIAFVAEQIAVEVDGWAWHVTPERFVRDRQRQNTLVNGGWRVLRFSWHDLTMRPDEVLDEIRVELAR